MLPVFGKGKDPLLLPPNIFKDWSLKIGICLKFVVFKIKDSFFNPVHCLTHNSACQQHRMGLDGTCKTAAKLI